MKVKQRLLIRADASPQIGAGHVMRCLALAQAWQQQGGQVYFVMANIVPSLAARLQAEGMQVIHAPSLSGSHEDAEYTITQAKTLGATWVVVDGYQFGAEYQQVIKATGLRLLFLDDYGHAPHYWADLVVNQNIYAHERLYARREPYTSLLLGSQYVLLRQEFWPWQGWQRQIPTVARRVLVTLGGADPDNVTLKVIQALQRVQLKDLEVVVVVGGNNPHYEQLQTSTRDSEGAIVLTRDVTNMPELMAWADVAITAGGSTCWELAWMRLPCVIIILAENQQQIAENLDMMGVAMNLGWHTSVYRDPMAENISELLYGLDLRREMVQRTYRLVDGNGSSRVIMHMQDQKLRLRAVSEQDCELLWQWANDPEVRARSFASQPIPWNEHVQWFNAKRGASDCRFYIAIDTDDTPIGSIRFDIDHDEAIVSIAIDNQYRGQGYGSTLIDLAVSELFATQHIAQVNAYIQPDNQASIRAFLKAGFQHHGTILFKNTEAVRLVKQHELRRTGDCSGYKHD
jgi:UDP-2,4-diacetamido-2,4,6-trideoxy-beta-L-altropyranose hydrolase